MCVKRKSTTHKTKQTQNKTKLKTEADAEEMYEEQGHMETMAFVGGLFSHMGGVTIRSKG